MTRSPSATYRFWPCPNHFAIQSNVFPWKCGRGDSFILNVGMMRGRCEDGDGLGSSFGGGEERVLFKIGHRYAARERLDFVLFGRSPDRSWFLHLLPLA